MSDRLGLSPLVEETANYLKANVQVLLPLAGAFFFLPSVIMGRFLPQQVTTLDAISSTLVIAILVVFVVQTIGQLTILGLYLLPGNLTVRQCLEIALRRLGLAVGVQFLLFAVICGVFIAAQLLVLLLAGGGTGDAAAVRAAALAMAVASPFVVYLVARLFAIYPLIVAEGLSPFAAMRRAFGLTAEIGWKLAGFLVGGGMLYLFVQLVLGSAFRVTFQMLGNLIGLQGLGALFSDVVTALLGAIASLFFTVAMGVAYKRLSSSRS